jgi:hypothetical protein
MNEQQRTITEASVARHLDELTAERNQYRSYSLPSSVQSRTKSSAKRDPSTTVSSIPSPAGQSQNTPLSERNSAPRSNNPHAYNNGGISNVQDAEPYQETPATSLYTANTLAGRRNILRVNSTRPSPVQPTIRSLVKTTFVPSESIAGVPRTVRTLRGEQRLANAAMKASQNAFNAAAAERKKVQNAENYNRAAANNERETRGRLGLLGHYGGGKRTKTRRTKRQ